MKPFRYVGITGYHLYFFFQIIGWCELTSVLDVAIYKIFLLVLLKLPQPSTVVSVSIDHSKLNIPIFLD